jgi:hypothetical protein
VQALVRVQLGDAQLLELRHGGTHPGLDRPLQLVVALPEAVGERELWHGGPPGREDADVTRLAKYYIR